MSMKLQKENSIEEDITRVKQRIEDVKEYIEYGLPYSEYLDLENSFDNILSDYKRVLKENEELKKENEYNKLLLELNNNFTIDKKTGNYKWNVIEIQKIKDKIEEYDKQRIKMEKDDIGVGFTLGKEWSDLKAKIEVLQELLEERK